MYHRIEMDFSVFIVTYSVRMPRKSHVCVCCVHKLGRLGRLPTKSCTREFSSISLLPIAIAVATEEDTVNGTKFFTQYRVLVQIRVFAPFTSGLPFIFRWKCHAYGCNTRRNTHSQRAIVCKTFGFPTGIVSFWICWCVFHLPTASSFRRILLLVFFFLFHRCCLSFIAFSVYVSVYMPDSEQNLCLYEWKKRITPSSTNKTITATYTQKRVYTFSLSLIHTHPCAHECCCSFEM